MKIEVFTIGSYRTNCYMAWAEGSDSCIVVDPGYEPEYLLEQLRLLRKKPAAILITHGHFDHVGAVKMMAAETGCPVYIHDAEHTLPQAITAGDLGDTLPYPDRFSLAGIEISILHTPGHTPGSVCLIMEDTMFSGDTLFAGSCGRTDLPGGSWETICRSLAALRDLPEDYRVLPGHGDDTTLSHEQKFNPYLR